MNQLTCQLSLPGISLAGSPSLVCQVTVGTGLPVAWQWSTAPVLMMVKKWQKQIDY